MAKQERSITFNTSEEYISNLTHTAGLSSSDQMLSYTLLNQLSTGIETPITNTVIEIIGLVLLGHIRVADIPMHAKISLAAAEIMALYKACNSAPGTLPRLESKMISTLKIKENSESESLIVQPSTLTEKLQAVEEAFTILSTGNSPIRTNANETSISTDTSTTSSDDSVITVVDLGLTKPIKTDVPDGNLIEIENVTNENETETDESTEDVDNNGESTNEEDTENSSASSDDSSITITRFNLTEHRPNNFIRKQNKNKLPIKTENNFLGNEIVERLNNPPTINLNNSINSDSNILKDECVTIKTQKSEAKPKRKRKINMAAKLGVAFEEAKMLAMYHPSKEEIKCAEPIGDYQNVTCQTENTQKTGNSLTKQKRKMSHVTKTDDNRMDTTELPNVITECSDKSKKFFSSEKSSAKPKPKKKVNMRARLGRELEEAMKHALYDPNKEDI